MVRINSQHYGHKIQNNNSLHKTVTVGAATYSRFYFGSLGGSQIDFQDHKFSIAADSKLETTAALKNKPALIGSYHSVGDACKDPDYGPQGSLQPAISGVYYPSMTCTGSSAQKRLAARTPGGCSWGLHKHPQRHCKRCSHGGTDQAEARSDQ